MTAAARILIATTNPGKIREIEGVLAGTTTPGGRGGERVVLVSLRDFPAVAEPEETGETFAENSRLKALYYAAATGLTSVADDSGLEIDALDGAPGVHSARWHGTDYSVKFRKIYELLAERRQPDSVARFVCHVTLASPSLVVFESDGIIEGRIAPAPRGTNGFGYDPIFFYPPFGCTLAELDLARKATVSHRGRAFNHLRQFLETTPIG
jgi:XTP/dITP diphosphohydrolase